MKRLPWDCGARATVAALVPRQDSECCRELVLDRLPLPDALGLVQAMVRSTSSVSARSPYVFPETMQRFLVADDVCVTASLHLLRMA